LEFLLSVILIIAMEISFVPVILTFVMELANGQRTHLVATGRKCIGEETLGIDLE
jgi:hypothetical protein